MAKAARKDDGREDRRLLERSSAAGKFLAPNRGKTIGKSVLGTGAEAVADLPISEGSPDHLSALEVSLAYATAHGLVREGCKTERISARVDPALLRAAKEKTGLASTTDLVEAALAQLVAADDFGAWLISEMGTVDEDLDLEL